MTENVLGLGDYLAILRRKKWHILFTVIIAFSVCAVVAFSLDSVYRSSATILIEEQDIPRDLVRSAVTSYADQRIQMISQQVMSRANLASIVEKYNVYPKQRQRLLNQEIVALMHENITLEMVSADVIDPRSGRPSQATIAFTLAFDGETPQIAQRVTNELVSLFLSENIKTRQQKAAETSGFFAEEAAKLQTQIADLELKLSNFKQRNVGRLPEQVDLNMQLMDRTERELLELTRQVRSLEERKIYLEAELAQLDPNESFVSSNGQRILNPPERLRALQTEYLAVQGVYAPSHPDLIKMRQEIAALETQVGKSGGREDLLAQLTQQQAELEQSLGRYSENHPDVINRRKVIATLQESLAEMPNAKVISAVPGARMNPTYISLEAQLQAVVADLAAVKKQHTELKSKLTHYEQRLIDTPGVEREYLTLSRDYENALRKYQDIKSKQMEAQVSQELEQGRKGERFTLIDPPQFPEKPIKPNRPAILFLGVILSLAAGFAVAAISQSMDHSVRGFKGVQRVFDAPPLAVIPYIENSNDKRHKRNIKIAAVGIPALGLIIMVLLTHWLWMPLDVLWFAGQRKMGLL